MRTIASLFFLVTFFVVGHAFVLAGGRRQVVGRTRTSSSLFGTGGGPLDSLFAFLKDGKVGLVKSLAGEYDAVAVRNKIDGLVKENAVLMFSFTTCPYCIKGERRTTYAPTCWCGIGKSCTLFISYNYCLCS